jgi:hypothetical protein
MSGQRPIQVMVIDELEAALLLPWSPVAGRPASRALLLPALTQVFEETVPPRPSGRASWRHSHSAPRDQHTTYPGQLPFRPSGSRSIPPKDKEEQG